MTLGELIDKVMADTGLDAPRAMQVATELYTPDREEPYTNREIVYAATRLGLMDEDDPLQPTPATAEEAVARDQGELLTDPGEILAEVARVMPRVMVNEFPRIGKRPKDRELPPDVEDMIAELPEEVRLLILDIDLFGAEASITLYDEANDVDRVVGPIDLSRYESGDALRTAITTLLTRLQSKVLRADHN